VYLHTASFTPPCMVGLLVRGLKDGCGMGCDHHWWVAWQSVSLSSGTPLLCMSLTMRQTLLWNDQSDVGLTAEQVEGWSAHHPCAVIL